MIARAFLVTIALTCALSADEVAEVWAAAERRELFLKGRSVKYVELHLPQDNQPFVSLLTVGFAPSGRGEVWKRSHINGTREEMTSLYRQPETALSTLGPHAPRTEHRLTIYKEGRTLNLREESFGNAVFWYGDRFSGEENVFRGGILNVGLLFWEQWLSGWASQVELVHRSEECSSVTLTYAKPDGGSSGGLFVFHCRCRRDWGWLPDRIVDARIPKNVDVAKYVTCLDTATPGSRFLDHDIEVLGVRLTNRAVEVAAGVFVPGESQLWYGHVPSSRCEGRFVGMSDDYPNELDIFGNVDREVGAPCVVLDEFTRELTFYGDWNDEPLRGWKSKRLDIWAMSEREQEARMWARGRAATEEEDPSAPVTVLRVLAFLATCAGVVGLVMGVRRARKEARSSR